MERKPTRKQGRQVSPLRKLERVTIVCGPPGCGKSTWCQRQCGPFDIVWDLDSIAETLAPFYRKNENRSKSMNRMLGKWRDELMNYLCTRKLTQVAWIIVSDRCRLVDLTTNLLPKDVCDDGTS